MVVGFADYGQPCIFYERVVGNVHARAVPDQQNALGRPVGVFGLKAPLA